MSGPNSAVLSGARRLLIAANTPADEEVVSPTTKDTAPAKPKKSAVRKLADFAGKSAFKVLKPPVVVGKGAAGLGVGAAKGMYATSISAKDAVLGKKNPDAIIGDELTINADDATSPLWQEALLAEVDDFDEPEEQPKAQANIFRPPPPEGWIDPEDDEEELDDELLEQLMSDQGPESSPDYPFENPEVGADCSQHPVEEDDSPPLLSRGTRDGGLDSPVEEDPFGMTWDEDGIYIHGVPIEKYEIDFSKLK